MSDHGSFEYGGIRFTRMVPQDGITSYVQGLSDERRGDVGQIVMALESAGLLAVEQVPAEPSPQEERDMGYSLSPDPLDVSAKQYGAIESTSPTLSGAAVAQPLGESLTSYNGGIGREHEMPREMTVQIQDGMEHPAMRTRYVDNPDMEPSTPDTQGVSQISLYSGQSPEPPREGTLSASLKVDMGYLRGGGNR